MGIQDSGFEARIKRVQVKSRRNEPILGQQHDDSSFDEKAMSSAILLPQLAFMLGAVALVAGRGISMNYFMIEPSTDLLGLGEAGVVVFLLLAFGVLFGKPNLILHGALVVGASLAFLGEGYYIPIIPDLMENIYNPGYVGLLLLEFP